MNRAISHQDLPREWPEREKLREKGQFWTPDWVARAMVSYVIGDSSLVFDPAFGKGAFYSTLKAINQSSGTNIKFYGIDIDRQLVEEAWKEHSTDSDIYKIEPRDFIEDPPKQLFKSIVANPPYIRHHRLSARIKGITKEISLKTLGKTLDGRAGIHVYFLIQALRLLERNGKLAFIMPSDTCEGIFANQLWQWITTNYCLDSVITFAPEATPFPNVDTNAVIFLISNTQPKKNIIWVKVTRPQTEDLSTFVLSKFSIRDSQSLKIADRDLDEALSTGLSRDPGYITRSRYTLIQFATVMRGIATGANEFFFLTRREANKRKIPPEFVRLAIGRTRDVDGFYITSDIIANLDRKGRPTLLFSPDGRQMEDFPVEVQEYLREGERIGLPHKPLISSRKPWYRMEQRAIPPFLFAYLGRRNARFIRNLANVVPLTGFLCVYPHSNSLDYIARLWSILQHPQTIKNLNLIAKSYGSGAIKIEPRALERLPIPESLISEFAPLAVSNP
jgi:adenine-specific DNA-methyltransferase